MGLAPAVERRRLRVRPHPHAAQLVDDRAAAGDAIAPVGPGHRIEHAPAHLCDQGAKRLLHVLHLPVLVVGPLPVKPQHRDPPAVHHVGIDLAVRGVVGNHLAAPREADGGAVQAPVLVLERRAVSAAGGVAVDAAHEARARIEARYRFL